MRPPPHHLDLLLAIEHEAHTIAGTSRLDATLDRIRAEFQSHVIIKRGDRGALWLPARAAPRMPDRGRRRKLIPRYPRRQFGLGPRR